MYVDDMDLDEAMSTMKLLERQHQQAPAGSAEQEQLGWDINDLQGRIDELGRSVQSAAPTDAAQPGPGAAP